MISTKLTKVPFLHLQSMGHSSVDYVDDSYLQGDTCKCLDNGMNAIQTFRTLGVLYIQRKQLLSQNRPLYPYSLSCPLLI